MYPDDRVLVGVINRKRDLKYARDHHWYRIPQRRMPRGIHAEYVAFFLSGRVFKEQSGGIHYFARIRGLELAYRRDLLPQESGHERAEEVYYRLALDDLQTKSPPVLNPTRRVISFIYSTWDRFVHATQISDLYSPSDYYVDRVYHALRSKGIRSERFWESEARTLDYAPGLRILYDGGALTATTAENSEYFTLDREQAPDETLQAILEELKRRGGPALLGIPYE